MYDTAAHVEMVKQRIRQRQYRRAKNQIFALSAICVLLSAVLIGGTAALAGIEQAALPGLYGSMLLREGAGGYVLVGVLAFSAAVVFTAVWTRFRKKSKKQTTIG